MPKKSYRDFEPLVPRSSMAASEGQRNRNYREAMSLLQSLLENFESEGEFTEEDMKDAANTLTAYISGDDGIDKKRVGRSNFGPSHLKTLIDEGLLEFDEETSMYTFTDEGMRISRDL